MAIQETQLKNHQNELAWRLFQEKGIVDENLLRPDIARSWMRISKQKGAAPPAAPLPGRTLKAKQARSLHFVEAARPVLHDVSMMLENNLEHFSVLLLDREGDIIYSINRDFEGVTLGHRCSELDSGTTAGALALIEGVGVEVSGYEHIYPHAHNWHTIGVPIREINQEIAGVFGLLHAAGPCPPLTMQMVSLGAQLIENRLQHGQSCVQLSSALLDRIPECALLLSMEGLIVDANPAFSELVIKPREQLSGRPFTGFLAGQIEQKVLFAMAGSEEAAFRLNLQIGKEGYKAASCPCQAHKTMIRLDPNQRPMILMTLTPVMGASTGRGGNRANTANPGGGQPDPFATLAGINPDFRALIERARRAAASATNILIDGESGTGKEVLAGAIHSASGRTGPLIAVNCGSISRELLQSELFGYEEGAFTGARKGGNPGKFELADRGTLFLDEIGEMPLDMQVSLLRFLEDHTLFRVGGHQPRRVDVRIIAATNRDLRTEVGTGGFRQDLYYRLNVVSLHMPALRERPADIPLLAVHLLERQIRKHGRAPIRFDPTVIDRFKSYHWPGNVRELQNVIESSLIMASGPFITLDCLPPYFESGESETVVAAAPAAGLWDAERAMIMETLARNAGNIKKSARELGISRTTLYNKLDSLDIKKFRLHEDV